MKAKLKPIKEWAPHEEVNTGAERHSPDGSMRLYVGSLYAGWVEAITTEPEELFKFHASKLLIYMDEKSLLTVDVKRRGVPLQEIKDNVELLFIDFVNKICT